MSRFFRLLVSVTLLTLTPLSVTQDFAQKKSNPQKSKTAGAAMLWQDPGDIRARNLFYGPGGPDHAPKGPFKFVEEIREGGSPKFDVEDQDGNRWRVKLGPEAQPETAATRLLWAVGYFADEDYYSPFIRVAGLPKLSRGRKFVSPEGVVRGARLELKLKGEKKIGEWSWFENPFVGRRELNGLKVMMALINNHDLKKSNNGIYQQKGSVDRYLVTDVGSSFGKTGNVFSRSRGKLKDFEKSKFVDKVESGHANFVIHSRPPFFFIFNVPYYAKRTRMEKIPKNIPLNDVRWIAGLLSQLSDSQIQDVFRAAGYHAPEVEGFASVIRGRIEELKRL